MKKKKKKKSAFSEHKHTIIQTNKPSKLKVKNTTRQSLTQTTRKNTNKNKNPHHRAEEKNFTSKAAYIKAKSQLSKPSLSLSLSLSQEKQQNGFTDKTNFAGAKPRQP